MKPLRFAACLSGLAMWTWAFYVYEEYIYFLGFPDGHITELDFAEKKLAVVVIGVSVLTGFYLLYLGTLAASRAIGRRLSITLVLYGLTLVVAAWIDYHYRLSLPGGEGS